MAGRSMQLSVIVRLRDMASGPLGKIRAQFAAIGNMGRRIGLVGGAIAALSFAAPLQSAAAYSDNLRDIAITADLSGKAATEYVIRQTKAYDDLSIKVGQTNARMVEGAQLLIAAGMDSTLIDRLMPAVGRTATAANAAMEDTAKTTFALSNTLEIASDRMEASMGKLITAGKLGRFEFKDMAKSFPELTSQITNLGIKGEEAVSTLGAALQIAMYGTDSTDSAANNLRNFLLSISSPKTKKLFADAGVDIGRVMADATAKGINPVEAVVQKTMALTKIPAAEVQAIMDQARKEGKSTEEATAEVAERIQSILGAGKLGELFRDQQVLGFLVPMMANIEKYKEYKREIAGAGAEVIDTDFATRMDGDGKKLEMVMERITQLQQLLGRGFATNLDGVAAALDALKQGIEWFETEFPGVLPVILSVAGAMLMLAATVAFLAPVFTALGAIIAAVFSPIGIIVGGAALIIYHHWDRFAGYFRELWAAVVTIFTGAMNTIIGLVTGDFDRAIDGFKQAVSGLGPALSAGWAIISEAFRIGIQGLDRLLGTDIWGSLLVAGDELKATWDELSPYFAEWWQGIVEIFAGAIDLVAGLLTLDFSRAWDGAKRVLRGAGQIVLGAMGLINNLFHNGVSGAGQILSGGWRLISGIFKAGVQALGSLLGMDIWGAFVSAAEAVSGKLHVAWDAVMAVFDGDFGPIKQLWDDFLGWLSNWGTRLQDSIVGAVLGAKDGVVAAFAEMWDAAKASFFAFIDTIKTTISDIPGKIKSALGFGGSDGGEDKPQKPGSDDDPQQPQETGTQPFNNMSPDAFALPPAQMTDKGFNSGPVGGSKGFAAAAPTPAPVKAEIGGRIVVAATEGARIVNVESTNPSAPLTPDRGTVVGRP